MPRGAANQAKDLSNSSSTAAAGYGGNASSLYGGLVPQAQSLVNSPGYDPNTLSAITNAGMGGVNAGAESAKGDLARTVARTNNPAGITAGEDKIAQSKATAGGAEAGNIQIQNADFQNKQRMAGLNMLNSLYGQNVGAQQGMTGEANRALQTQTEASPGWAQTFGSVLNGIGGLAKGVGSIPGVKV